MNFLKRIFIVGPAFNRMAKAFEECLNSIGVARLFPNPEEAKTAAAIYRYGIESSILKWGWNPFTAKIYIPNYMELGRLRLNEAIMMVMEDISKLARRYNIEEEIENILDNEVEPTSYYRLIPEQVKNKIKP